MKLARITLWSALVAVTVAGHATDSIQPAATPIVVQNYYYALPGKAQEVFELRLHASEVRAKLGLRRGRVLRRISAPKSEDNAGPDVIWECDYSSQAAREKDVARLSQSAEFDQVEKQMDTLLRKFDRAEFTSK
jgi:hypothetical protein